MNTKRYVAILALILAVGVGSAASAGVGGGQQRVCFPAAKWDAPNAKRPCARIVRVFEDGSVRVRVEDASGQLRYRAGVGARDR